MIAFDTNILVYSEFEPDYPKGILARRLLLSMGSRGLMAAQAIGELFSVARRRWPQLQERARQQVEAYRSVFAIVATDFDVLNAAAVFSQRYQLQFWDAVIWQASVKGKATILLTEDMQHGFSADGMRAVNPFAAPDWPTLAGDLGISG
jgi:predicted nucleic acid-binding protein